MDVPKLEIDFFNFRPLLGSSRLPTTLLRPCRIELWIIMIPTTFTSATEQLPWIAYEPDSPDGRAVVIAYGSDGLAPMWEPEIRRHAEGLADVGILALIPDYLMKSPPIPHASSPIVFGDILKRHAEWAQVLRDAVSATKNLPSVDSSRVGLLGFSLGGFLALRIRDSVLTLVEFFAPYQFPTRGVPPLRPTLEGLGPNANPALKAQIYHGRADRLVPVKQHADSIEAQLESEGATVLKIIYPAANHGFLGDDVPNTDAREKSRHDTLAFFRTHL